MKTTNEKNTRNVMNINGTNDISSPVKMENFWRHQLYADLLFRNEGNMQAPNPFLGWPEVSAQPGPSITRPSMFYRDPRYSYIPNLSKGQEDSPLIRQLSTGNIFANRTVSTGENFGQKNGIPICAPPLKLEFPATSSIFPNQLIHYYPNCGPAIVPTSTLRMPNLVRAPAIPQSPNTESLSTQSHSKLEIVLDDHTDTRSNNHKKLGVIHHTASTEEKAAASVVNDRGRSCSSTVSEEDDTEKYWVDVDRVDHKFAGEIKKITEKFKKDKETGTLAVPTCRKCNKAVAGGTGTVYNTFNKTHRRVAVTSKMVKKHVFAHLSRKCGLFSCEYCGSKFQTKKAGQYHIKKRHMELEIKELTPYRALRCHVEDCDVEICNLIRECFGDC